MPPESFDPPPRVDSAVVRMLPLPRAAVADIDVVRLGEIVGVAFSQRRKMLRNTLGAWLTRSRVWRSISTCSAAPRKSRWPNTSPWRAPGRPDRPIGRSGASAGIVLQWRAGRTGRGRQT